MDRVAFLTGPLRDDSVGHSIMRLARELRRRGKEVGLACGGGALVGELERLGMSPLVTRHLARGRVPWRPPRKLLAYLREFGPELIHVFGRPRAAWGPKLCQALDVPYVLTVMAFAASRRNGRVEGDWRCGSIIAVSEEVREQLVNHSRIPKDAIAVIPMGIALEDYQRYCCVSQRPHRPVVGTVGPLTRERGCDIFLRAARQVLDAGHDALFLIAGQGPERDRLRRLVRKLNMEAWVTMVHEFADYRRMMAVLDVCVLPALQEGMSLNVLEAMACRKPVVATGVGAVYDVVADGETGFLAPRQDPGAIAEKIIRLIEDDELAQRIVEGACERIRQRYSLPASVGKLLDFYSRSLARTEGA
ncbi:MAG: glycosyltransferase family 4 protein [Planctomycetota bacterium]